MGVKPSRVQDSSWLRTMARWNFKSKTWNNCLRGCGAFPGPKWNFAFREIITNMRGSIILLPFVFFKYHSGPVLTAIHKLNPTDITSKTLDQMGRSKSNMTSKRSVSIQIFSDPQIYWQLVIQSIRSSTPGDVGSQNQNTSQKRRPYR